MTAGEFTLEIGHFRGPLGLLLDLIEQKKLQVNDVSLAGVSDDYVQYIQDKERVPLSETAQFVVVAATLLLIKSRSLLPTIELTTEEEEDIKDLEKRLELYAHTRRATKFLRKQWGKKNFLPINLPQREVKFSPASDITVRNLAISAKNILEELPTLAKTPTAKIGTEIKLEDVIENLTNRMRSSFKDSFKKMTSGVNRVEAIVSFLALLELVKRGTLGAEQHSNFDDITMLHEEIETPSYN